MKKILFALLLILSFVFVKAQIPQAPIIFNTIQQMVNMRTSYTIAKVNDVREGGIFNKILKGSLIIDSGIVIPSIDPNYVWIRDISQSTGIHIKWFCKGDSVTDDANKFQNAINTAKRLGMNKVVVDNGKYSLGRTIFVPFDISLEGTTVDSVTIYPISNKTYWHDDGVTKDSSGFLFWINLDTLTNDWIRKYPSQFSGEYKNFYIDGSPTGSIGGFYFSNSAKFFNIQCRWVNTLIRKKWHYLDQIEISHINASYRPDTTNYLVKLEGNGDGMICEDIEVGYFVVSGTGVTQKIINTKGLYISSATGGRLLGINNGDHYITRTQDIMITNAHIEGGSFTFDGASANFRNNLLYTADSNRFCINVINTSNEDYKYVVNIDQNVFVSLINNKGGWDGEERPDIQINTNRAVVNLNNNRRESSFPSVGNDHRRQALGIMVGDSSGIWDDWANYSYLLSAVPTTISQGHIVMNGVVENHLYTYGGVPFRGKHLYIATEDTARWKAPTGNYYYRAMLITDPVRMIGRNPTDAESAAISMVSGEDSILELGFNRGGQLRDGGYTIRVFRGTASHSYDKYVDIPAINLKFLNDNGVTLSNFPWKSRTVGDFDSLNLTQQRLAGYATYTDGLIRLVCDSIPVDSFFTQIKGTWMKGDEILFRNAKVFRGFLRLTDGSNHVNGTDWQIIYNASDPRIKYIISQTTPTSPQASANIDIAGSIRIGQYLYVGTVPNGTAGVDSPIVRRPSDSSFRKIAPTIYGTATLAGGSVIVNTIYANSSKKIFVNYNTPSGTQGFLSVPNSGITNGVSFTINSSSVTDNSTVNWIISP